MNLLSLVGLSLKSDKVIELLEHYDLAVIYDFDRLHENIPDIYWASSPQAGFELRFNEEQLLSTIFMYALHQDEINPIDPKITGVPFYRTFSEASTAFQNNNIPFRTSTEDRGWIKGDFGTHQLHYEYNNDGVLSLVTIIAVDA
jgi:hypothetical protein